MGASLLLPTLAALVLALALVAVPAARASDLSARFSVAAGRAWVRTGTTTAGDDGWTPYSTPGVLVWDGGSIMGSFGISPGRGFAEQTLRRLPRACRLSLSATPGARIGGMIAQAPEEVDRYFSATADADICVVQGGAADLKHHAPVAEVFSAVKRYCEERRAAGFMVVVLSLLPRSDVPTFEADRTQFNTRLRQEWQSFADGMVDLAADPRIGDAGDNKDLRYYRKDQKHPNAKGCGVMAALVAPVLRALEWRTASVELRLRNGQSDWTDWRPYARSTEWTLEPGDGRKVVECEYRDAAGPSVSASDTTSLDTVRPTVEALHQRPAAAGGPVKLAFRADDEQPCSPRADVTFRVLKNGRVLSKGTRSGVSIGARHVLTFNWALPAGNYVVEVRARDRAGNPQLSIGTSVLVVR
jgi:hypothetical protein